MASRLNKVDTVDVAQGALLTAGCIYALLILAFWVTVVIVVLHFVGKFW